MPRAEFSAHDARTIRRYLTASLGFPEENIALLVNDRATKSDLEKYIESWLPNRVGKGDSVLIYYSGHGAPNVKTKDAYLLPYDGDPSFIEKTGYPLAKLYAALDALPANDVVVVLDSCFSGAGGRSVIPSGMRPMAISVESPALASAKVITLSAGTGEQVSSAYADKAHGLLTYFFLKGLHGDADQDKDGAIGLTELYNYLKPNVERIARREFNSDQIPQLLGNPEILKKDLHLIQTSVP